MLVKNVLKASSPPADAPMPTTRWGKCCCGELERRCFAIAVRLRVGLLPAEPPGRGLCFFFGPGRVKCLISIQDARGVVDSTHCDSTLLERTPQNGRHLSGTPAWTRPRRGYSVKTKNQRSRPATFAGSRTGWAATLVMCPKNRFRCRQRSRVPHLAAQRDSRHSSSPNPLARSPAVPLVVVRRSNLNSSAIWSEGIPARCRSPRSQTVFAGVSGQGYFAARQCELNQLPPFHGRNRAPCRP
jgi:hypothetical protein